MVRASAVQGVHELDLVVNRQVLVSNLPDGVVCRPAVRNYGRAWQHELLQYREEGGSIPSIYRHQESLPCWRAHFDPSEDPLLVDYPTDVILAPAEHTLVYLDDDARSTYGDRVCQEMLCAHVAAEVLPVHDRVTGNVHFVVGVDERGVTVGPLIENRQDLYERQVGLLKEGAGSQRHPYATGPVASPAVAVLAVPLHELFLATTPFPPVQQSGLQ